MNFRRIALAAVVILVNGICGVAYAATAGTHTHMSTFTTTLCLLGIVFFVGVAVITFPFQIIRTASVVEASPSQTTGATQQPSSSETPLTEPLDDPGLADLEWFAQQRGKRTGIKIKIRLERSSLITEATVDLRENGQDPLVYLPSEISKVPVTWDRRRLVIGKWIEEQSYVVR